MEDNKYLTVKNYFELESKKDCDTGLLAYAEDDKTFYIFTGTSWEKADVTQNAKGQLSINLYDINKSIVEQLGPMKPRKIKGAIKACQDSLDRSPHQEYYLLYGREIGYFTLFKRVPNPEEKTLMENAVELLQEFSEIYDIYYIENQNVVEFWIKYKDNVTCLYLGGWDEGMVEFNG